MKKFKLLIMIFVCLVVWIGVFLAFSKEKNDDEKIESVQYLFLDNSFFWKYSNKEWSSLNNEYDYKEFSFSKFDVYSNGSFYNSYSYAVNDGVPYFFDDDLNSQSTLDTNLMINSGSYFSIINYVPKDFSNDDNKIVMNFLKKNNIEYSKVTFELKYSLSSGGDIYILSDYNEGDDSSSFCFIFYRYRGKNYLIVDKRNSDDDYNFVYDLAWVVDIDNNYNNFIFKFNCDEGICYDMFQYVDGEYVGIIGSNI